MSAALLLAFVAIASTPPVAVTGDCPSAAAVTAALGAALGGDARPATADVPRVADLGERFQVAAPGRFSSTPIRRATATSGRARPPCSSRWRSTRPSSPRRPRRHQRSSPCRCPPRRRRRDGRPGRRGRLDGGPSAALGAELRAAAGRRWLGVAATVGVLAPTESTFASISVRQQRFPLSLAVTARRALSERLMLAGAVGAALVPLTFSAEGLPDSRSATRLDAGFRLAIELMFQATPRFRPFVDLHAELFPRPYELVIDPLGNVGTTGRLWVGISAGVMFEALAP